MFLLYTVSAFFLIVTVVSLLKFIWPLVDTAYIELPLLVIYNALTFFHFYTGRPAWLVVAKSIILIAFLFFITQVLEELGIEALT